MNVAAMQRPCRVLIVDDHVDTTTSYSILCQSWGHDVQIAFDAETALSLITTFEPDVALIDLLLPGLSGYELARTVRAMSRLREPKLVAMTGLIGTAGRAQALEAGFHEFLSKPIRVDRLYDVVKQACLLAA